MSVPDVLPPSPPTTLSRKRIFGPYSENTLMSTPDDSPASFQGSSGQTSKKRVEFSPWTNIHDSAPFTTSPAKSSTIRLLPPSKDCQSASKSILKISADDERSPLGSDGQTDLQLSMNEKMESIIQQLSQNHRAASIDAYQTFASMIKAYDEVPEEAVLRNKMTVMLKCIRRDLTALDKSDPEPMDISLVTQALKVLVILVWSQDFSSTLTDEFRIFILDRSIQIIAEHTAPKSVIIHYMHLLAIQDFRPSLLASNNRSSRLLEALKTLTDHIKGNGAISERLLVYQKLVDQSRSVMKTKANLWIGELLMGMTSSIPDTRTKAIALGMRATSAFPTSPSISIAARSALDCELETGKKLGLTMCRKLEKFVAVKDELSQVPQIWAIILLLCNAGDGKIDAWPPLKEWLKVIQKCFNSSDTTIRQQANMAWNRFVFVVRPHEASDSLVSMLAKPIVAQLEHHGSDKGRQTSRTAAISSYCNLLYYAFRPAASHKQYTRAWNEYIVKILRSSFFKSHSANADIASRALLTLFWNSSTSTKLWNENRAHENRFVEPEELPTIDCKWIRSNCTPIMQVFGLLFQHSSWGPSSFSDQALVFKTWRNFLRAVREASSKEIKTSNETKQAISAIVHFLDSPLTERYDEHKSPNIEDSRIPFKTKQIVKAAVSEIGVLSFLEALEASPGCHSCFILTQVLENISTSLSRSVESAETSYPSNSHKFSSPATTSLFQRALGTLNTTLVSIHQKGTQSSYDRRIEVLQCLSRVLLIIPAAKFVQSLNQLEPALSLWLTDTLVLPRGMSKTSANENITVATAYEQFLESLFPRLSAIDVDESISVSNFTDAASRINYATIVLSAVRMWNTNFAHRISKSVAEVLQTAGLLNLYQHLDSVSLDAINDTKQRLGLIDFEECESSNATTALSKVSEAFEITTTEAVEQQGRSQEVHRHLRKEDFTFTDKPQSDECQAMVQFDRDETTVEPLGCAMLPGKSQDSHSKAAQDDKLQDNQRLEPAVIFPDIRSSSRQVTRSPDAKMCEFARKVATLDERPSTPTLPYQNDRTDLQDAPSPTPRSKHLVNKLTDIEVPSSPPSHSGYTEKNLASHETVISPLHESIRDGDVAIDLDLSHDMIEEDKREAQTSNLIESDEKAFDDVLATSEAIEESLAREVDTEYAEADDKTSLSENMNTVFPQQESRAGHSKDSEDMFSSCTDLGHISPSILRDLVDGDDMDLMSASQLSQDLDFHLTLETQEKANVAEEKSFNYEQQEQPERSPSTSSVGKTRKRKSSSTKDKPSKRVSLRSHSQSSPQANQRVLSSDILERDNEVLDCVNVDIQKQERRHELNPEQMQTPTKKQSKRGRPRKSTTPDHLRNSIVITDKPLSPSITPKIQVQNTSIELPDQYSDPPECYHTPSQTTQSFDEAVDRAVLRALTNSPVDLQPRTSQSTNDSNVAVLDSIKPGNQPGQRGADDSPTSPTAILVDRAFPGQFGSGVNILCTLQHALEQLKSNDARTPKLDLRAIDDLCFQIRFQAQLISQSARTNL